MAHVKWGDVEAVFEEVGCVDTSVVYHDLVAKRVDGMTVAEALKSLAEICDQRRENDELREQLRLERQKVRQLSELSQQRIAHAIDETISEEPGGSEI
jgi:hypothetical protein